MILRSSSTPVLGSLLSSFSETPNNNNNHSNSEVSNSIPHNYSKLCYNKHVGSQNFTSSLYHSSPISPSVSELSGNTPTRGFRRAQSEGNLEGLVGGSSKDDEFSFSNPSKKFARRPPHCSTLEAIPSFSFHSSRNHNEDKDQDSEEDEDEEIEKGMMAKEKAFLYDSGYGKNVGFEEGGKIEEMYLARGLGMADFNFVNIGGHGGGGGGRGGQDYRPVGFDGDGDGDSHGLLMEEHYKKMLEENPCNPLYLRNYAQFLHQTKRDPQSAEEYYSRAILADPTDGEVLCQYGKLVWELYHDKDRANDYFQRAVRAAGEDSHVQAAYASFLWETDDEDEDLSPETRPPQTLIKEGVIA
ncbi:hypothetical protein ACH5RR_010510 [Cinchona calisaya]|uniref:TmcB/TmcC TPR repeats domain-containing protein n=1 Tax=Cinchona calisaya TaxID=153742 RepID=A0ABD3AJ53_9GENT